MPGPVPLHIVAVFAVVMTGFGFTITVMVYGSPWQFPVVAVGVTIYSTVPEVALLGFVKVLLSVAPDPALAPEMDPVMVPMVQANVLGEEAVKSMLDSVSLQIDSVFALVTEGFGSTVTVIVYGVPWQLPAVEVGVIMYSTVPPVESLGLVKT